MIRPRRELIGLDQGPRRGKIAPRQTIRKGCGTVHAPTIGPQRYPNAGVPRRPETQVIPKMRRPADVRLGDDCNALADWRTTAIQGEFHPTLFKANCRVLTNDVAFQQVISLPNCERACNSVGYNAQ